jgi:hypothetical protein
MADRSYRILVARDRPGIFALAGEDWTVLANTIREFRDLDSDDDLFFGNIGRLVVGETGFVALAFK